jgi:4-hydroxy-tetrahydrodipicolinate reductase
VVIDFSIAAAVPEFANVAARAGVPIVTGTTNLSEDGMVALDRAANSVPVVWARNMSLGVEVLAGLVEEAIRRLGPDYDVEIVEVHHRRKVDSPSGTALRLADAVSAARHGTRRVTGRAGQVGARTNEEVGVFGVRGGDVIGDHTVHILGPGERIELTHRATSRDLFAQGAVRAARFVVGKPPGRYSLADVLG